MADGGGLGGSGGGLRRQQTGYGEDLEAAKAEAGASAESASASGTSGGAVGSPYKVEIGGITDPGVPGKQNQDDFFFQRVGDSYVLAVLDGHGRELGQLASHAAKESLRSELCSEEAMVAIEADPKGVLTKAFATAHKAVDTAFTRYYEERGWVVKRAPEGFLTRMRGESGPEMCVHGGTTCTVLVLLRGRWLITANVGDSSGLLCGMGAGAKLLPISAWHGTTSMAEELAAVEKADPVPTAVPKSDGPVGLHRSFVELSADHGPECLSEYLRMRDFRPSKSDGGKTPELLFVYDTLTASKLSCPPIFVRDPRSGEFVRTNRGAYYKNVRNEWATLVATPPLARYQDALAFTRSLGDLHLQSYGVSHAPDVQFTPLCAPSSTATDSAASASGGGGGGGDDGAASSSAADPSVPIFTQPFCIALCSDGIWDNWKFEDLAEEVTSYRGKTAQEASVALMSNNLERGRANFGSSADNMTCVLAYITPVTDPTS